jgi:hypothetical protein
MTAEKRKEECVIIRQFWPHRHSAGSGLVAAHQASASFIVMFRARSGCHGRKDRAMSDVFLEYHHFEPLVGKTVTFTGIALPGATLLKVIRGEKFVAKAQRDPFILIFRSPKLEYYMMQGMHECTFEDGPTYSMYVSPVHTVEPEFQDYQAVFN